MSVNKYRTVGPPVGPPPQALGFNVGNMVFSGWTRPLDDWMRYQAPYVTIVAPAGVVDPTNGDHISGEVKYTIWVREGVVFPQGTWDISWTGGGTGPTTMTVGPGDSSKTLTYNGVVNGISATLQGAPPGPLTSTFESRASRGDCIRFMESRRINSVEYDDANPDVRVVDGATNRFYHKLLSHLDYAVDLAEANSQNLWICFHHLATDANITAAATAIAASAFSGTLYVEHSNEIWNSAFPQHAYGLTQATNPPYTGGTFQNLQAWHADRTHTIGGLVKAQIPGAVVVWGTQSAVPAWDNALAFAQTSLSNIDAIGIAPYMGGRWSRPQSAATIQTLTDQQIADGAISDLDTNVKGEVLSWKAAADARSWRLLGYEGGAHLDHADSAAEAYLAASSQSVEMGVAYGTYLDWWHANVADLLCLFQDVGDPDDPWSHLHGERGAISPRWQAFLDRAN